MIRLTILSENTVRRQGLLAEHGFSCWVETPAGGLLFDTGQGMVLEHNARALGITLSQAQAIALSHGHYDHTGRLDQLLKDAPNATLYAHPDFQGCKYSKRADSNLYDVGAPKMVLDENRYVATCDVTESIGGCFLTGPIPRQTEFEDVGGLFYCDDCSNQPDLLRDDQALFFRCREGLVILLGCAHSGVVNTVMHVCERADINKVYAIVGGMHLVHADNTRINETIRFLKSLDLQILAPAHCTGFTAKSRLAHEIPHAFKDSSVGTHFTFV